MDYQTRDGIPYDYDNFVPYAVVSTLPAAGDWIMPGTTVVLGVRAPNPGPEQPAPQPTDGALPFPAPPRRLGRRACGGGVSLLNVPQSASLAGRLWHVYVLKA